ncbi:GNAT family N-acetyltransferase [Clostridium sp. YB-6]|uniref:GNAT family N-acetyltransferase n=1 Tax=Clostridium weizhouense TaxID=2859781 RepID=A0ABS7ARE9_9CLOT|nr:GNAT family N-acetyltransferase [Clostridium weizhouense]
MKLKAKELIEEHAKQISKWKYCNEYAVYNLPNWENMIKENYALCDKLKRKQFTSYINNQNEIIGFINLHPEENFVFFGIGINPKYCNKGLGKEITKLALNQCKSKFPNRPVVLKVRTWNKRAINCYKSQGFEFIKTKHKDTYMSTEDFYLMKHLNKIT